MTDSKQVRTSGCPARPFPTLAALAAAVVLSACGGGDADEPVVVKLGCCSDAAVDRAVAEVFRSIDPQDFNNEAPVRLTGGDRHAAARVAARLRAAGMTHVVLADG